MPRVPNFNTGQGSGITLFDSPTVSPIPNYGPDLIQEHGQALQSVGYGLLRINENLKRKQQQLQDFNDEATAKSLESEAWDIGRNLSQNKDTGYLWSAGSEAVNRYQPTIDEFDKRLEEIAKRVQNPMQQQLLGQALTKMRSHFAGEWEVHAGKEMRANAKVQATARLERFSEMASQNWQGWENENDATYGPNTYRDSRSQIVNETAALAKLEGIAPDSPAFQSMLAKNMQEMHKTTVVNILKEGDPAQAQRYAARFLDEGELDAKTYGATRTQARAADDKTRATAIGLSLWQNRGSLTGDQLIADLPNRIESKELQIEDIDEVRKTITDQQTTADNIKKEQLAADIDTAGMWFRAQRQHDLQPDIAGFRRQHPDIAGRIETNGGFEKLEALETKARQPGWAFTPAAVATLERMREDGRLADQSLSEFTTDWFTVLNAEQMTYWKDEIRKAQEARGKSNYKPELSEHDHAWVKWLNARPADKKAWEDGKNATQYDTKAKAAFGALELSRQRLFAMMDERVTEADAARAQMGKPAMTRKERDEMVGNMLEDFQLTDIDKQTQLSFDEMDKLFQMDDKDRLMATANLHVTIDNGEAIRLVDMPKDERLVAALMQEIGYSDYTSIRDVAQLWTELGRPATLEVLYKSNDQNTPMPAAPLGLSGPAALDAMGDFTGGLAQMLQRRADTRAAEIRSREGIELLDEKAWLESQMRDDRLLTRDVNPGNPTVAYAEAQARLVAAQKQHAEIVTQLTASGPNVAAPTDATLTDMQKAAAHREKVYGYTLDMAGGLQQRAMQAVMLAQQVLAQTGEEQYLSDQQKMTLQKQKEQRSAELLSFAATAVNHSKNLQEQVEAFAVENLQMFSKAGILDSEDLLFAGQRIAATADHSMPSAQVTAPEWWENPNDPQYRQGMAGRLRVSARIDAKPHQAQVARTMHDELLQSARVWRDVALSYYPIEKLASMSQLESQHRAWLIEHAQKAEAKAKSLRNKYQGRWDRPEKERQAPQAKQEHDKLRNAAKMARESAEMSYPAQDGEAGLTDNQKTHLQKLVEQAQIYERKADDLSSTYSDYWSGK